MARDARSVRRGVRLSSRALDRDDVVGAMRAVLPVIERLRDDVRIVGTASSLLRGIDIAAGDVDILVRHRPIVDELAAAAAVAGGRCVEPPQWLENPGFGQFFSSFELAGVRVEFCTVEPSPGESLPFGECDEEAPWAHFDIVRVEGFQVPLVASELRLHSEVARFRPDRWEPIAHRLVRDGYDEALFDTALQTLPVELQEVMRGSVRGDPGNPAQRRP